MSDPDFYNAIKRTLLSTVSGCRLGKTLVVSSLLLSLGATFSAQSAIRILGPVEESPPPSAVERLAPQSAVQRSTVNRRQTVGPTRDSDTLWSIATRYQPNNSVTVYQTLGAIFRLNPTAFEDNNIHGLIPGSTLQMPTLTEIRRESTDDVASRLQIDQARKEAQRIANQPLSQQVQAPAVTPKPAPKPLSETPIAEPEKPKAADMAEKEIAAPSADRVGTPEKPSMDAVQEQINESDLQMGKLVESNHILKIRLAEVQNELVALKDQMSADEELTEEIREFLDMQRMRQEQMEIKEPSFFESLMASPLMLATMAIIPALLVIGAAAFFIMRRRKEEDMDVKEPEGLDGETPEVPAATVADVGDETDDLILEDDELEVTDETDADELFGDDLSGSDLDDINLSDSFEVSEENNQDTQAEGDHTSSLDVDLDDDFDISTDLDVEASADGAIGLKDMELALDEMSSQSEVPELSPDEALAAMWEQSLSGDSNDDVDDIDALLNAEQSGDAGEPETGQEPDTEPESIAEPEPVAEDDSEPETNEALFDNVLNDEPEVDLSQDIDLSDDDIDDLIGNAHADSASDNTEADDDEVVADPDALLDEMLDDDLLEEDGQLLDADEPSGLADLSPESEDTEDLSQTDALLDELISDDGLDPLDESALLDEPLDDDLLGDMLAETQEDDVDLGETDVLLDELVDDGDDLNDESALLDDVADDDLLSEDLIGFDNELDIDTSEESVTEPVGDLANVEAKEEAEQTAEAQKASLQEPTQATGEDDTGAMEALDALVEDSAPENEPTPEASESELELLDDVLEQDDIDGVRDGEIETAAENVPVEEPDATQEDMDLLDNLLDESAEPEVLSDEDAQEDVVQPEASGEDALPDTETHEVASGDDHGETAMADDAIQPDDSGDIEDSAEDVAFEEEQLLDLSSLPEYDEEAALADSEGEPEPASDERPEEDDDDAPLDLENLPEFTEEDAASEYDVELSQTDDTDVVEPDEGQESTEAPQELSAENEPVEEQPEVFSATENNTLAFPKVDPISLDELGEFDEDAALGAALEEQRELEEFSKGEDVTQPSAPVSQTPYRAAELDNLAQMEDDDHQVAGLNMEALLSEDLEEVPAGLGDFETEEPDIPEEESDVWRAEQAPEPELESEDWSEQPEVLGDEIKSMDLEGDLEGLLDDVESELVEESAPKEDYISIDELMKDDGEPQEDPDSMKMDLDVGLEDFPDVLSDIQPADVDSAGEAATNMDLAKAYLEMNDIDGAIQLLEKVMQGNDPNLKEEARKMIENLN